jgi:hypothetical protein
MVTQLSVLATAVQGALNALPGAILQNARVVLSDNEIPVQLSRQPATGHTQFYLHALASLNGAGAAIADETRKSLLPFLSAVDDHLQPQLAGQSIAPLGAELTESTMVTAPVLQEPESLPAVDTSAVTDAVTADGP